jgi:thiol-disulfide isomerase/thioredoxin
MTDLDKHPRRRRFVAPVLGALALVAAGAVLYGTVAPAGKAASDCPADSAKLAAKLGPLARGELAALQVSSEPRRAIPIAFQREDGTKLTLADFKGRAVLLNLWATWCIPCRVEMPALDRLQAAKGGPGFEVVAVNVDTAKPEKRAAFLDSVGIKSLARYLDASGDAFETLHKDGKALGLPVTLLVDKDGCELGVVEGGAAWDSAKAQALIATLKGG